MSSRLLTTRARHLGPCTNPLPTSPSPATTSRKSFSPPAPLLGATVVFETFPNAGEVIRTVKRERATALITVPYMLDLLRNGIIRDMEARGEAEWFERAFKAADGQKFLRRAWIFRRIHRRFGWKFWAFISGGAALSAETEEFFKRLGYAVVQGYGMTETASLISLNHP